MHIQVFDNLSHKALSLFKPERYQTGNELANPDVILVRSHKLHDYPFGDNLKAVGRAGAGTDNIPVDTLTRLGIPVFYAPGANANAVKELVLAAMLMGYRNLDKAHLFLTELSKGNKDTLKQDIELNKKKFVGHEIAGKTLGVIGLGNIGVKVANAALALGMKVLAFDPEMTMPNALALMPDVEKTEDMDTVLSGADIVTLHVPLNEVTTDLINAKNLSLIKSGCLLLNFSRQQVVNEEAVLNHLQSKKLMGYITDFPTAALASHEHVLCFPHLGASTHEAERNCADMVIGNLCNYLEQGNIACSVNFPDLYLPPAKLAECRRLLIVNTNVPGALGKITQTLSELGYNIEQMVNNSRGQLATNLIDISGPGDQHKPVTDKLKELDCVIRVYAVPPLTK